MLYWYMCAAKCSIGCGCKTPKTPAHRRNLCFQTKCMLSAFAASFKRLTKSNCVVIDTWKILCVRICCCKYLFTAACCACLQTVGLCKAPRPRHRLVCVPTRGQEQTDCFFSTQFERMYARKLVSPDRTIGRCNDKLCNAGLKEQSASSQSLGQST